MTEVVERTLTVAKALAAEQRHGFVGTEHLLAALLADDTSLAATLFLSAGIDPARARQALLTGLRQSPEGAVVEPALSRFAERVVEAARGEVTREGRDAIEDRDLLRQLLAQPKGRMAQLLKGEPGAPAALRSALGLPEPVAPPPPPPPIPQADEQAQVAADGAARGSSEPRRGREPGEPRGPKEPRERKGRADPGGEPRAEGKRDRSDRQKREDGRREETRGQSSRGEPRTDRSGRDRAEAPVARPAASAPGPRRVAKPQATFRFRPSWLLFLGLPAAFVLRYVGADPLAVFGAAAVGAIALSALAGHAFDALADRAGSTIGAVLQGALGNLATMTFAVVALVAGRADIAQSVAIGGLVAIALLVPGLGGLAAGIDPSVRTNRSLQRSGAGVLGLAVAGLLGATLFVRLTGGGSTGADPSFGVGGVLVATYLALVWHARRTREAAFGRGDHSPVAPPWGPGTAAVLLAVAGVGLAVTADLIFEAFPGVVARGIPIPLVTFVLIPLVTAVAERSPNLVAARRGRVDLAWQGAFGAATQASLVLVPVLVAVGAGVGTGMSLVLGGFELFGGILAVATLVVVASDQEVGWFRSFQMVAMYAVIAVAAVFI